MSGFANPIFNNAGGLKLAAVKSPNYVPGVSGWSIFKNGNAEFNQGTFRAQVIVGNPPNPQVKVLTGVNIPVTFQMHATGVAPTDVTSVSNLQQVIEFPSNNAAETAPPIMGEVIVTYTDASTSDGFLTVNGVTGTLGTEVTSFTLQLSQSSSGVHGQCTIFGQANYSAGTIVLSPQMVQDVNGDLGFYVTTTGPKLLRQLGTLIPADETWTAFNPLVNGWAVNASYTNAVVRLVASPRNCIQFDALLNCTGATVADGTIVGTVPARFRPVQTKTFPVTCDQLRVIAAGPPTTTQGARFSLDSSGNLKCFGIAAAATQVSLTGVCIPLDTN